MKSAPARAATPFHSRRDRMRHARLTPLLLTLALGQAYAVEVRLTGADGIQGVNGKVFFEAGQDGGAAPDLTRTLNASTDGRVALTLVGGTGGSGGYGGPEMIMGPDDLNKGGAGGNGGNGATARGSVGASLAHGALQATNSAFGGTGGGGGGAGCCFNYSNTLGGAGARGGDAGADVRADALGGPVIVQGLAVGGNGGNGDGYDSAVQSGNAYGGDAGHAETIVTGSSATGAASGSAIARGGNGGLSGLPSFANQGSHAGNASAALTLRAAGIASGVSQAVGGTGAGAGSGVATMALSGAGANGRSEATGRGNGSQSTAGVRALTSGALAVDVSARAGGDTGATMSSDVYVDSGYFTAAAGRAAVLGSAYADGGDSNAFNSASVMLYGSGAITGASIARGADGWGECYYGCAGGGGAFSLASGTSSGRADVTITATAAGGKARSPDSDFLPGGSGQAIAYGKSAGGVVHVRAEALTQSYARDGSGAKATAITTAAGGASFAEAKHVVVQGASGYPLKYAAEASASAVGERGARALASGEGLGGALTASADASGGAMTASARAALSGSGNGSAEGRANVGGAFEALPAFGGGMQAVSYASAAPRPADVAAALANSPDIANANVHWYGAGAMAAAGGDSLANIATQSGFTFTTVDGQHLLVGLFAPVSTAFGAGLLDFSITNNGVQLFSRTFGSGDNLDLFFTDRLLDLGLVGAGAQNLLVSATWEMGAGTGYGFRYLVGASAVPEPGTWLMLLAGLGGVALAARRRRAIV